MPGQPSSPRVVVLGGGFAGLQAARSLRRAPVEVVLVDRQNHHLFQPLLYQVAMGGLSSTDIAVPIRRLLHRQANARVLMADVVRIDPAQQRVQLSDGELSYDYLVVALGASHSYFGHDEWARVAPGLKSVGDALEIRRRVLTAYEAAERESDAEKRRACLTFVIVGAGPTGVELAGSLAELSRFTIAGDFRNFTAADDRILLIDAADRILHTLPPELSAVARQQLERMGVEVRTSTHVVDIDADGVTTGNGRIAARTVIWAAGVQATPVNAGLGAEQDRQGRVRVTPDLSLAGHPEVFVCGDAAAITCEGQPVPGIAPAAIQAGRAAARNIACDLAGRPREPFVYVDRGTLATIGRSAAVGVVFGRKVSGLLAWLLWLFVHIMFLVTFRNRLMVLLEWAWAYASYQRNARIIVSTQHEPGA